LSLKLSALVSVDSQDDALNTYSTLRSYLEASPELDVTAEMARAIVGLGEMLRTLERYDEAIAALDFILDRVADKSAGDPELTDVVLQAWTAKGAALGALKRFDEAV